MDGKAKGFAIRCSFLTCFSFTLTDRICKLLFSANWILSARVKMVATSCANTGEMQNNTKENKTNPELRANIPNYLKMRKGISIGK